MYKVNIDNTVMAFPGHPAERREEAERERLIREMERKKLLASLTSPHHEPMQRIRLWEQLFGLNLPRDALHKLIDVIARQTNLSLSQVQAEQTRRSLGNAPKGERE